MIPVEVAEGDGPIILGQPHGGTQVPDAIFQRLNATGRALADTDWHINRLYSGLIAHLTVVEAGFHRYVIDANRGPDDGSLYPGQNTTGLCPLTDFDGRPIWAEGQAPGADEIAERRAAFHAPYHQALAAQIDRVKARHGVAILWDCHSIRSVIPFLFDGELPVFNIGTNGGTTCAEKITRAVETCCEASGQPTILNGRFKGGWTTRHYGQPADNVHAIQMETAQRAYLATEAAPWAYDPDRAERTRAVLGPVLADLDRLARSGALSR
ncbi:N-formylglutamate deformylase [Albidovulum sp.]|jgi:formiminoglutamase|uniref:N-formylglutamate deformylase n=1 Tax=Albidovulum sp. TaxID=1872424 RepID=UPI00301F471E